MATMRELIRNERLTKQTRKIIRKGLENRIPIGENWTESDFDFLFLWFEQMANNDFKNNLPLSIVTYYMQEISDKNDISLAASFTKKVILLLPSCVSLTAKGGERHKRAIITVMSYWQRISNQADQKVFLHLFTNLIDEQVILKTNINAADSYIQLLHVHMLMELDMMLDELKQSLTMTTMKEMLKIASYKSWHLSIKTIIMEILLKNGKIDKLFSRAPEIKKEFLKPTRSSIRLMLQFMVTSSQILEVEAIQVDKDDMRFRSPVYLSWTSETLFLIGKNTTGCIAANWISSDRLRLHLCLDETARNLEEPYFNIGSFIDVDIDTNLVDHNHLVTVASQLNIQLPSKNHFSEKMFDDPGPSASVVGSVVSDKGSKVSWGVNVALTHDINPVKQRTRKLCRTADMDEMSNISSHSAWSGIIKNHKEKLKQSKMRLTPKQRPIRKSEKVIKQPKPKKEVSPGPIQTKRPQLRPFGSITKKLPNRRAKTFAREAIHMDATIDVSDMQHQNALFDRTLG